MGASASCLTDTIKESTCRELLGHNFDNIFFAENSVDGCISKRKLIELSIRLALPGLDQLSASLAAEQLNRIGLTNKTESGISYTDLIYVVCDKANIGNRDNVALRDVFDCNEWKEVIDSSGCTNELFLVNSTYVEFLSLPNAKVLSYRWGKVIDTCCAIKAPGCKEPSFPRKCSLSVDIFRVLKGLDDSLVWIDFLSHLSEPAHQKVVMNRMGSLYLKGTVWPMYLQDYSVARNASFDAPLEALVAALVAQQKLAKQNASELNVSEQKLAQQIVAQQFDTTSSLRRGWIQQEISFGKLDYQVVRDYVGATIVRNDFESLRTLIRRRAQAMDWLFTQLVDGAPFSDRSDVNDDGNTVGGIGQTIEYHLGISPFVGSSIGIPGPCALTRWLARLIAGSNGNDKDSVEGQQNRLSLFADQLTVELCKPQVFDSTNLYHAFQLVRSFAESQLTYESDCYFAMTLCATLAAGLPWVHTSGDAVMCESNLEVLHRCWCTLMTCGDDLQFYMRRSDRTAWAVGLLRLVPLLQAKCEQKNSERHSVIVQILGTHTGQPAQTNGAETGTAELWTSTIICFIINNQTVSEVYVTRRRPTYVPDLVVTRVTELFCTQEMTL